MDVDEIPSELLSKIRERFYATPKVRQMETMRQLFIRNGDYGMALSVAKDLESFFVKAACEYIEENRRQVEKIDVSTMDIPQEDKDELMRLLLVCFMCADMIKSSVQDMDSILHKYDKDLYVEMFNDIGQVMEMAEEKLHYLQENSGYLKDLIWGERCDDMYEVVKSKAASIMRKRKNDPNWGKNTEKFYK